MGILPGFKGILCHDHWKPYYKVNCTHALCNAHHLRELTRAFEQDDQKWAQDLNNLLLTINNKVIDAGGALDATNARKYRLKYREIIKKGDIECQSPSSQRKKAKEAGSRNQNPEIYWNGSGTLKMAHSDLWKMLLFPSPIIWVKTISE